MAVAEAVFGGMPVKHAVLAGLVLLVASTAAHANPDIWVKAKYLFHVENEAISRLTLEWQFDRYFSDRTIRDFDGDGDGTFSETETGALKEKMFDLLADKAYHLHVVTADAGRDFDLMAFEPRIEDEALVVRFTVGIAPAVNYRSDLLIASLHDDEIIFDFSLADENFLLVEGELDAACTFRIGRGKGRLSDHRQAITLACGDRS
jgi:ABC-type uncharacterized transport system substrate-binding protein